MAALLVGKWHLIPPEAGAHELYDVKADPDETNDLARAAATAPVADSLRARLEQLRGSNLPAPDSP